MKHQTLNGYKFAIVGDMTICKGHRIPTAELTQVARNPKPFHTLSNGAKVTHNPPFVHIDCIKVPWLDFQQLFQ